MLSLILGQSTSFVALFFFLRLDTEMSSSYSSTLLTLLCAAEAGFVTFFAIFVSSIVATYRRTFFSTITAKKFRIKAFREATTDQKKILILKLHPAYYASIRSEVEQWVDENWDSWNEEQPDWFTERVKASVTAIHDSSKGRAGP